MDCDVSSEQLWSWVDRDAPELDAHVANCPTCRERAEQIRRKMRVIAAGSSVVIPDRVGPYTIDCLIGEGGQALVYQAEQPDPRRSVALKVLKGGRFASEKLVRHFRRESEALAHLQHPGIATIYEAGHTDEGLHYFAMELVEGAPLNAHVRERNPTREKRLELFLEICRAVEYAHRRGVVHRDLKPSNIIVEADGSPKILDFGLAKLIREDGHATRTGTRTGQIAGTPRYMSPEQARGLSRKIDARSDVYSLGVVLYELLTDRAPHEITDFTPESLRELVEGAPARPGSIDPSIGCELDTIVLKALEKDPERRYGSVAELAEDLRRFRNHEPILARPPSLAYSVHKRLYRYRRWGGVLLIAAVALVTGRLAVRMGDRPPYDRDRARMELLTLRGELLSGAPGESVISRAVDASLDFKGLPEAVLLRAQAFCLTRTHDLHRAAELLEVELARDPRQWPYRALLAEIKGDPERTDDGEPASWSGDGRLLDSPEAHYLRSFATLDLERALASAHEAVRRDAAYVPALATLAILSPIRGDVQSALDWTDKLVALKVDPGRWTAYRVRLLFGASRFEEALLACDTLVAAAPEDPYAHFARARTLRRLKRYPEARLELTTGIDLLGWDSASATWPHYHRGTLNWILGRENEAIRDYEQVFRSLTYATRANARLFFILDSLGRRDEARETLAEARRRVLEDPWLTKILSCLAGELTPAQLVAAAADPVQSCEAYYYAGEVALLHGRTGEAGDWFRRCVATGLVADPSEFWEPMSEYELAEWRLSRLPR